MNEPKYAVSVSYLQIYQECVQDLLKPKNTNMRVRESPTDGVYVEGLMQAEVSTREETLEWLSLGGKNRSFAQTACNETSSRSHTLFIVTLTQTTAEGSKRQSKLCLADLAGSEKVSPPPLLLLLLLNRWRRLASLRWKVSNSKKR